VCRLAPCSRKLASTFDPSRTAGEHDLLAAYRALNSKQQGAVTGSRRRDGGTKRTVTRKAKP
jgi:hypothetical protein